MDETHKSSTFKGINFLHHTACSMICKENSAIIMVFYMIGKNRKITEIGVPCIRTYE